MFFLHGAIWRIRRRPHMTNSWRAMGDRTVSAPQVSEGRHLEARKPDGTAQGNPRRPRLEGPLVGPDARLRDHQLARATLGRPSERRGRSAPSGAPSDGGAEARHGGMGKDEERPPRPLL